MMSKVKEAQGIKRYIAYIKQRIFLIKSGILFVSDNEFQYHIYLYNAVKEFAKTHRLYIKYILGRLDRETAKCILGFKERQFFRYCKAQRTCFIDFMEKQEEDALLLYPYSDGEQEIAEIKEQGEEQ